MNDHKKHVWTRSDDIVVLYLYKYGYREDIPGLENLLDVSKKLGIKESSIKMRINNFRFLDGQSGLSNYAVLSSNIYHEFLKIEKESHLKIVKNIFNELGKGKNSCMRYLRKNFLEQFVSAGSLSPILARVKTDQTLMLAIRDGYVNIYYRGGNLLRIREKSINTYEATFDENYNISGTPLPDCPKLIHKQQDAIQWVESFSKRKEVMNVFLSQHDKSEREFQQLVARENNASVVSNESEYFVVDIEAGYPELGARFDILAIRWLANQRGSTIHCRPALIEMKYGDGALGGTSGVVKHLQDLEALIMNRERYSALLESMSLQFEQLYELGLFKFNRSIGSGPMTLNNDVKPEVIFLLANHNPRSTKLKTILSSSEVLVYQQSKLFDLRFFVSSFAGYSMHNQNMKTLDEFLEIL